ncbi:Uncharacterised protein [Escherichia coli]|nr:Uncharacterised protein [Escherichia coli]
MLACLRDTCQRLPFAFQLVVVLLCSPYGLLNGVVTAGKRNTVAPQLTTQFAHSLNFTRTDLIETLKFEAQIVHQLFLFVRQHGSGALNLLKCA